MTRWIVLVLAIVGLSAVATVLVNYMPSQGEADLVPLYPTGSDKPKGPPPEIEIVGNPVHNFGLMTQQDKGHKTWEIKNVGTGDLILTGGHPSCSCTLLNLKPGMNITVKPGDHYDLEVEWETRDNKGAYSKNASLYTNDPGHPELTFIVEGEVQPAIIAVPEELQLSVGNVENDKPHEYYIVLASPDQPDMKVVGYSSSRPEMLEFSSRELNHQEKSSLKFPRGLRVTVTLKPIPILGPFHEEFVIKTDHPRRAEIHREISGTIVGPLTFNPSAIRLSEVDPKKGDSFTSRISILGAESTTFKVLKAPEKVKVTIVPVDEKIQASASDKTIRYYEMNVTVEPGLPTGVVREDIILGTDHPRAAEVRIPFYAQIVGD